MDVVSRKTWGAVKEQNRPAMPLPAREVWLHHTVTRVTGDPHADAREVQRVGIARFGYISYSYLVHPTGVVLEGQGLRVGAHTKNRNSISYGVSLIGNYEERQMEDAQVESVRRLVDWLQDNGKLRTGVYPTGAHRDLQATACCGRHAYARLPEIRRPWEPPPDAQTTPAGGVVVANAPFAAILAHPRGGYLQVGRDGGIFNWGDAPFFGSLGGIALNAPVSGAAWTPTYEGYWMCAEDGGVFAFGDAVSHGSMGGTQLNAPVIGMSATDEGGYLLIGRDGGVFAFGPGAAHHGNALYSG